MQIPRLENALIKEIESIIKIGIGILALLFLSLSLDAHCNAWDGPVVLEAREAFESSDVETVLKWVFPEHEAEVRAAFEESLEVADESDAAGELAELWFLETLVAPSSQYSSGGFRHFSS